MSSPRKITIGDQQFEVQRFRGLKAILAMAAITRIARDIPDILADVAKDYQRRNTVVITEAMSRLPRWESFGKEDFDAAEKETGKREIELPAPMSTQEQTLQALPKLLEGARTEAIRLLALMIIPNQELREADENEKVEDALDKYREVLLYEAEIDELADLAIAASEVLNEQLAERKDNLGNMMRGLWKMWRPRSDAETSPLSLLPTQDQESTPQTSTEDVPTSSTDSESLTDGTEPQPSMESLGVS